MDLTNSNSVSAATNSKLDGSNHTAATNNSMTGSSSSDDFWNLDLDDILSMPADAATEILSPPLQRSLSADTTTSSSTLNKVRARRGRPGNPRAAPPAIRRTKSNEDAPIRATRTTTNNSSKSTRSTGRSLSPIRFPKFGRSKTLSPLPNKTTSNGSGAPLKRTVSFDKVQVREFQQILGDNPCQDDGPSLGLGWNYHVKKDKDLEKYEAKRNSEGKRPESLSPLQRTEKALQLGYSPQQILKNKAQHQKVQKQRRKTAAEIRGQLVQNEPLVDPTAIIQQARQARGMPQVQ